MTRFNKGRGVMKVNKREGVIRLNKGRKGGGV